MNDTSTRFSRLLEEKGFPMAIINVEDRGLETIFAFGQNIKNNEVNVVIDFDEENTCIDFNILNLVILSKESSKEKVFNVLNEFNKNYRFPKFYLHERTDENGTEETSVAAQITIPYENPVSEEMMFDMLRSMISFCNGVVEQIQEAAR